MARKRHKPEEIVAKLREVDVLVSQGQNMSDAIRQIGVSEVTYYRWRQEFGGAPDPRFVVWRSSEIIGRHPEPAVSFPISGPLAIRLSRNLVGVAGFEPAIPSSRTR